MTTVRRDLMDAFRAIVSILGVLSSREMAVGFTPVDILLASLLVTQVWNSYNSLCNARVDGLSELPTKVVLEFVFAL